jgi:DHA1 family multidrug resistance protein-like MFS transporter
LTAASGPDRGWEKNQRVMTAVVFVVFTGFAIVVPFLPLFVRELGVENPEGAALWAGALIGVSPLLAGLLAPVWGRLADRHGQKAMALRALVAYVLLMALSAAVRDVYELLACRVGIGLFGGIGPLALAMATSRAPREQTGRAVGLVQAAQILSAAVGPVLGGALADSLGMRRTFLVTSVLCALTAGLVAWLYEEPPPGADPADPAAKATFGAVLRLPGVGALLLALFLVNFVGRSFTPILPLHLERLGVAPHKLASATGALISAYSIAAALSAAALGRASRSFAPRRLLAGSLLGGAATVSLLAAVPSFPAFLALAALLGLASGGALTLCYTIGGLMVPAPVRTTAFGFFSGAALFGGAVSPSAAGLIAHVDLLGIYWVDGALFGLLAAVVAVGGASGSAPDAEGTSAPRSGSGRSSSRSP